MMTLAQSIGPHRNLPWRLRHQIRRLGDHPRAVAQGSGAKEWSDRAIATLRPSPATAFLRRNATRYALLACLYLLALAFLGASVERYWHWVRTTEAVAGEPVRKVDRWTAHCRVRPWLQGCRPASRAERGGVRAAVVSARTAMSASDHSEQVYTGAVPFELAAAIPEAPALDEYTW
jgi:hypothetical protein